MKGRRDLKGLTDLPEPCAGRLRGLGAHEPGLGRGDGPTPRPHHQDVPFYELAAQVDEEVVLPHLGVITTHDTSHPLDEPLGEGLGQGFGAPPKGLKQGLGAEAHHGLRGDLRDMDRALAFLEGRNGLLHDLAGYLVGALLLELEV